MHQKNLAGLKTEGKPKKRRKGQKGGGSPKRHKEPQASLGRKKPIKKKRGQLPWRENHVVQAKAEREKKKKRTLWRP